MQSRLQTDEFADYDDKLQVNLSSTWVDLAKRYLAWERPPQHGFGGTFTNGDIQWFADGLLDPTVSCLERHLSIHGEDTALIAIGDDPDEIIRWSFRELFTQVCKAANVLSTLGVKPGDTVGICLPNIPEAAVAMLACARLGAIHGVVFAGFGASALAQRWQDLGCHVVITADIIKRGGRTIALKETVDCALQKCPLVTTALVVCRSEVTSVCTPRERCWDTELASALPTCAPYFRPANAPLFVLHTSGSTGQPKGLVQSTAGFLLHAAMTMQATSGYQDGDNYACLADLGWITGHAYVLYGPLINGAPIFLDEGTPLFPDPHRYWRIVEHFSLNILFTVPTALRMIAEKTPQLKPDFTISSLRTIMCAGEILDKATCDWLADQLPHVQIINIYGQTEASGHLLAGRTNGGQSNLSCPALRPCLGIRVAIIDEKGVEINGHGKGHLVIKEPWPGLALTILGDDQRFKRSYFQSQTGRYFTGDIAERDDHNEMTIIGRSDEVVNIAGHRLAPAEVEAITRTIPGIHDAIAAAIPDSVRGHVFILFIVCEPFNLPEILKAIRQKMREQLGAFASPRAIVPVPRVPRTRSGKPLRRLLTACVQGLEIGDISTLADDTIIPELQQAWQDYLSSGFNELPTTSPGT